jgi:hypothetical protein
MSLRPVKQIIHPKPTIEGAGVKLQRAFGFGKTQDFDPRHVGSDPNVERYDPDQWTDEFAFLNRPGQVEIQSDLFYDYRTNVYQLSRGGKLGCVRSSRACW